MKSYVILLALGLMCLIAADAAMPSMQNTEQITLVTNNGWMLTVRANGSAVLVFGSGPMDKSESPAGTFSLQEIYGTLVPKLKATSEQGDVAVALRAAGEVSTTARYIDPSTVRQIFAEAQQHSTAIDKTRFDALVRDHPIEPNGK